MFCSIDRAVQDNWEVIAGRFCRNREGLTIDLASGECVTICESPCGGAGEQRIWGESCAAGQPPGSGRAVLTGDPGSLVDFGVLGQTRRFEAYRLATLEDGVRVGIGPRASAESESVVDAQVLGDLFESGKPGQPRCVHLRPSCLVPSRAAVVAAEQLCDRLLHLARRARLEGYVPVSSRMLSKRAPGFDTLLRLLSERHVSIFHDPRDCEPAVLSRWLIALCSRNVRPHLLILTGDQGIAVKSAASVAKVAETAAQYRPTAKATSPDLERARLRVREGVRLAAAGKHAAAERLLRESATALARRGDPAGAGEAALALGCLLLDRGRVVDGVAAFEASRDHYDRGGYPGESARAAALIGFAWTDDARLIDAEAIFRATAIAATQISDPPALASAEIGLARCLLWQGRYAEADDTLQHARRAPWNDPRLNVAHGRLAARIALASNDLAAAGSMAAAALEQAVDLDEPALRSSAHRTVAAVEGAIGNVAQLRHHLGEAVRWCRRAHQPLNAVRARLCLLDGLRQAGRLAEAQRVAAPLRHAEGRRFPALLSLRIGLTLALIDQDDRRIARARAAAVARVGKGAAERLVWSPRPRPIEIRMVDDLIELLHVCHDFEDELTALERVAAFVRERARAAAATIFGWETDRLSVLVSEGSRRPAAASAERAVATILPIPPWNGSDGLEAAAPIRYGPHAIGALACRWSADESLDPARVSALLSAAAAACAGCLRVALDRRSHPALVRAEIGILGDSEMIRVLRQAVAGAAAAPFAVLIEGESGSGKELVARALHRLGPRRDRKFCALNCAALTDDLIEAELFGHARGAFTGALADRVGLFEEADEGTLFLDEVGELTLRAQAKLLRVIQEGEIRRVGENLARRVEVRIVAATNRDLRQEVAGGRFRQDLLYRLDVIRITVPPLRRRAEDVPALAAHFWQRSTERMGGRATLSPAALAALARYDWPGNVRELQNVLAALAVTAPRRGSLGPKALPAAVAAASVVSTASTLDDARRLFEQRFVRAALARAGGHRGRAAADLGVTRQGFAKLLTRLELDDTPSS